jgi:hypothetical protein
MAVKSLHQIFYYHGKYLNSMKCREIRMDPSIQTIQCSQFFIGMWTEMVLNPTGQECYAGPAQEWGISPQ